MSSERGNQSKVNVPRAMVNNIGSTDAAKGIRDQLHIVGMVCKKPFETKKEGSVCGRG